MLWDLRDKIIMIWMALPSISKDFGLNVKPYIRDYREVKAKDSKVHPLTWVLDTRRDSRIARLQKNKQPIKEQLKVYLTADD